MRPIRACIWLLAGGLAACTFGVDPIPVEPAHVASAYADRVPGRWAVLVDADKAKTTLEARGMRCDRSDYPLDLTTTFAKTAEATFEKVADNVRVFDHGLSRAELDSGGYTGVVTLRVSDLRAKLEVTGVIETQARADTEMDASILVIKGGESMVDSSQSGKGDAERGAGLACGGAADAVSAASDTAIQDLVTKLAEQFANSHAVRYSPSGLTPQ